jgi:hypothetical protein
MPSHKSKSRHHPEQYASGDETIILAQEISSTKHRSVDAAAGMRQALPFTCEPQVNNPAKEPPLNGNRLSRPRPTNLYHN